MFNNLVDMGFYYGTLIEGIETPGAALMYGKMMLYKITPLTQVTGAISSPLEQPNGGIFFKCGPHILNRFPLLILTV